MRTLFLLIAGLLFITAPAGAQQTPNAEVFGGYQYQSLNAGGQIATAHNILGANAGGNGCQGFGAGVAYHLNDYFAAVGDVGACKETGLVTGLSAHDVNFLFGPRVTFRSNGKVVLPFVQVLLGGQYATVSSGSSALGSATSFATIAGGGADLKLTDHIALRGQADYLYTKFVGKNQNSALIQLTLVYHWGTR